MKYITILILSLFLISCNNDDIIAQDRGLNTIHKTLKEVPESFIGEFEPHQGETVEGKITITKTNIIINTTELNYNIDVTNPNIKLVIWCNEHNIKITFVECKKVVNIIISNYLNRTEYTNYITLSKDYNIIGNFDLVKEEIPQELETPINNNPQNN